MRSRCRECLALALFLSACSGSTPGPTDAGPVDAGPADAGPRVDAGPVAPTFKVYTVSPLPLFDLAIDAQGRVWGGSELGAAAGQASLIRFDPTTLQAATFNVAGTSSASSLSGGLAIDAQGHVWVCTASPSATGPSDPGTALVELDADGALVKRVVNPPDGGGCTGAPCAASPFTSPHAVAIDAAGQLWVADQDSAARLTTFTGDGAFVRSSAITGPGSPFVQQLAIDAQGTVYTTDEDDLVLVKVTPAGVVSTTPLPSRLYSNTVRMLIAPSGTLWIAGTGNLAAGSLNRLSPDGTDLGYFDLPDAGTADGIAIDHGGTIWVADNTNRTVLGFDGQDGHVVASYPNMPSEASPGVVRNMAVDAHGNLWIASSSLASASGTLLLLPGIAAGPESFPFAGPVFPY